MPTPPGLAERIITAAAQEPPATDPGGNRRAKMIAPVAAALAVLILASGIVLIRHERNTNDAAAPVVHTYLGLHLPVPADWKTIPNTVLSAGMNPTIGYITDQTPQPECRGASSRCAPPIRRLQRGGVLIVITVGGSTDPSIERLSNTYVAGLPAQQGTHYCIHYCQAGGASVTDYVVHLPQHGKHSGVYLYVKATFGAHAADNRHAFNNMMNNARYP